MIFFFYIAITTATVGLVYSLNFLYFTIEDGITNSYVPCEDNKVYGPNTENTEDVDERVMMYLIHT